VRVVLQRVSRAEVRIDGRVAGRIGAGFCLLVGFTHGDTDEHVAWMADKVIGLRLFADDNGKMNRALAEVEGAALLVVSQFTLYGDCRKGRRPSFDDAAPAEQARALYQHFVAAARNHGLNGGLRVETGVFQAHMAVSLINDGPVTLILESG